MERGLLWLPLLTLFFGLAWQGWNEYQKIEAYKRWASQFERAKYDIYSVLGQKARDLTWGKPTRKEPLNLQTFSLQDVQSIQVLVDGKPINLEALPLKGRVNLQFSFSSSKADIQIPFTEIPIALEWGKFLQRELEKES